MSAVLQDAPEVLHEQVLAEIAAECASDPLRFVMAAFPWGEPGTDLEGFDGPEEWQKDILREVGRGVASPSRRVRMAIAAGHGIGKSAAACFLILWAMATCADTRCMVLANTSEQVIKRTFAELEKWHRLCLFRDQFTKSATALVSADPMHVRTWRADAVSWSIDRPEAVAGTHNAGKRVLVLLDEASSIPDVIWDSLSGAMSDADTDLLFIAMGNPTRLTGAFHDCFFGQKTRWITRQVDSRSVRITDKQQIQDYVDTYGEDSDFLRVRVRGVFPRAESSQFISSEVIEGARKREASAQIFDALIIGVDVARSGGDQTVIAIRKGRDARTYPWVKMR